MGEQSLFLLKRESRSEKMSIDVARENKKNYGNYINIVPFS
jgi:hypothetical protein